MKTALMILALALVIHGLYCFVERRKAWRYRIDQAPRAFVALVVGILLLAVAVSDGASVNVDSAPTAIALVQNR